MESFINRRMTNYEARERFRDSYILMRYESDDVGEKHGTVLWVGADEDEAHNQFRLLENQGWCGIIVGENDKICFGSLEI
jgi:hypothetical protein